MNLATSSEEVLAGGIVPDAGEGAGAAMGGADATTSATSRVRNGGGGGGGTFLLRQAAPAQYAWVMLPVASITSNSSVVTPCTAHLWQGSHTTAVSQLIVLLPFPVWVPS